MSATYFETVQRQVRRQNRRVERCAKASTGRADNAVRDPAAETRSPAISRLTPGIGLTLGALASLGLWLAIGKLAFSLIG